MKNGEKRKREKKKEFNWHFPSHAYIINISLHPYIVYDKKSSCIIITCTLVHVICTISFTNDYVYLV